MSFNQVDTWSHQYQRFCVLLLLMGGTYFCPANRLAMATPVMIRWLPPSREYYFEMLHTCRANLVQSNKAFRALISDDGNELNLLLANNKLSEIEIINHHDPRIFKLIRARSALTRDLLYLWASSGAAFGMDLVKYDQLPDTAESVIDRLDDFVESCSSKDYNERAFFIDRMNENLRLLESEYGNVAFEAIGSLTAKDNQTGFTISRVDPKDFIAAREVRVLIEEWWAVEANDLEWDQDTMRFIKRDGGALKPQGEEVRRKVLLFRGFEVQTK